MRKRTPRKLAVRTETLRTLAGRDLVHVVGGVDDTHTDPCTHAAVAAPSLAPGVNTCNAA